MTLYFVTGNKNKFVDAQAILPEVKQIEINLPEIQELDPQIILKVKLEEAFKHAQGEFIVDDVSVHLDALNGFPGPLIRWFMKSLGVGGIANLVAKLGNAQATVKASVGYAKSRDEIYFFESERRGKIVQPRGHAGFGWDVIFQPEDSELTYAELKEANPGPNAMRTEVLLKLKDFLKEQTDAKRN